MDIMMIVVLVGVGIAIGMYIASQISHSIDRNIQQKQFMENFNSFDKRRQAEIDAEYVDDEDE